MERASFLADVLSSLFDKAVKQPVLSIKSRLGAHKTIEQMVNELLASKGEVSSSMYAELLFERIESLSDSELGLFFTYLADSLDIDTGELKASVEHFAIEPSPGNLAKIGKKAEARRCELFRRLISASHGVVRLVFLRKKLLTFIKGTPNYKRIDNDLVQLFGDWFNKGFLVLRPIDWTTQANILEKIIEYEAVHEIGSWKDLRERLNPVDRRCFAFFHPAMEDEPLIFVEVALMANVPEAISEVLDKDRLVVDPYLATTAVFYSISNCQKGLAGISFGNFLIKKVVETLRGELPNLNIFTTLSPVPGYTKWVSEHDQVLFKRIDSAKNRAELEELKPNILESAGQYLFRSNRSDGKTNDPVARFHLGNGASLHQINFLGDLSKKGIKEGAGLMVNYRYVLKHVEQNHESYQSLNKIIAAPKAKKALMVS